MHNHDVKYPARPGFEPGTSVTIPSRYERAIGAGSLSGRVFICAYFFLILLIQFNISLVITA